MSVNEYRFRDKTSLQDALITQLSTLLINDLETTDEVCCLLSGGSSPAPLYSKLAELPLPWQRIHAALVDERWVDITEAGSNEAMLRTTLKQKCAADVQIQGMKNAAADPAGGVKACNELYQKLPSCWTFALLGMGIDGHTASLFPASSGLPAAITETALCHAITANKSPVTGDLLQRMTVGLHALIRCKKVILLITGQEKLEVYHQALQCKHPESMPVAYVLQHPAIETDVYWSP